MLHDLKPYPAYRDSGVPWLGQVPEHWDVRRNGQLFAQRNQIGFTELPILEVSINTGVQVRELANSARKQMLSDPAKYKRAVRGDLAYNMMRMWQGAVGVAPTDGLVSPAYVVAHPLGLLEPFYAQSVFRSPACKQEIDNFSRGIVKDRNRLYWEDFKQIRTPCPPMSEQGAIVRFIRHIERRMQRYIRAKQRLIKLLEEQRRVIIHRAITRGIDPNVRLKPSGVDWMGDVPEHWQVLALKHVLRRLIDCKHKTAPFVDESDFRVVRTTAIRNGKLRLEGTYCTSEEAFADWTRRGSPEPGDVIFTREAPAGEACIVPSGMRLCLGQRTVLMKLDHARYDSSFLIHMIYAGPPRDRIRIASQGSTVGHFNVDDIAALRVIAPPLDEQELVVRAIEEQTRALQSAMISAEREIALIREYRTRLIADVVTGKLDVREAAAHLPDEADEPEMLNDAGELDEDEEPADVDPDDEPQDAEA